MLFRSDYVFNCAGWVYLEAGALQKVFNQSDIPPEVPLKLNTTSFKYIIPKLYETYPNEAMEILMFAPEAPVTTFNASGAFIEAEVLANVSVLNPTVTNAFSVGISVIAGLEIGLSDESNITGKISEAEIILRLVSSSVGPIHLSLIDELFRLLIDDVLIPLGNHYLDIGYPLPSFHGVHFVNATVEYGADYVALGTSVHAAKLLPALLGA